ncbi:winged helix-turn-helix transcriptional regulator [Pseudoflavonifractor sp. BSD2780061688st1 E11]|uniref:winged helix-turn-helix transcriptional regulator n=1 Tax=Oscillospiraceae TaxID=216572 RepID=UPI001FA9EF57|nr:winged helix-turn-helix transcriptional regulator [Pseudoflavonifractor sp. BSD2780061688st1 E11]
MEFKRCGNGIESDVYETVCSFLNRFGGDIFLGVLDDGTVLGVPENAAADMVRNFISCVSNPALFTPTVYLSPKVLKYEGKTIIHIHVLPSAEVHSYKKIIYDRIDMLPKLRIMAENQSNGSGHPWSRMTDDELLKSARLYSIDRVTGEQGFNLAAVMLLGKDDVILDIVPAYVTDALLRRVNIDRYDDREIIQTNLIESYERLMEFGRKHLLDKFFLEDDQRKSLRNIITREMIANTLIHREYTSSYQAKFVIEKERMYVENANRASQNIVITPDNMEPIPKNPIIASFFRNIGYADQLGSGVRNLFKYSKFYSGNDPEFIEGDIFKIIVPLDEGNREEQTTQSVTQTTQSVTQTTQSKENDPEKNIMELIEQNPFLSQKQMAEKLNLNKNTLKYYIKKMKEKGVIERVGTNRKGKWIVKS